MLSVEIQKMSHLGRHAIDVFLNQFDREQISFLALTAGIPNHPRRATHKRNRPMPLFLKPPQRHDPHQVPDVHAVYTWIKASVKRARFRKQPFSNVGVISRLMNKPTPTKVVYNIV